MHDSRFDAVDAFRCELWAFLEPGRRLPARLLGLDCARPHPQAGAPVERLFAE